MHQFVLDDGTPVRFGQRIEELETLLSTSACDNPSRIARKGIDRKIKARGVILEFDTGRLRGIEFDETYRFKNPLTPYAEVWKNFPEIDDKRIHPGISREEFSAYLVKWEERAKALGAEKTTMDDLGASQFRFCFDDDKYSDMFQLSMGPSRRAGGGGIWADGWTTFFAMETDQRRRRKEGAMISISAFRDEFNTVARKPLQNGKSV